MQTNFLLGDLQLTERARLLLRRIPYDLVARHAVNEHGHITSGERKLNAYGMETYGPIKSRYKADPTNPNSPFVVIETTELWVSTIVRIE